MIEVVVCDEDGTEFSDLGRRFHDFAAPEIFIDGCAYEFVRFKAPRVVLYRRRRSALSDERPLIRDAAS